MTQATEIVPGLPAVRGKPVHVGFKSGGLTSDAGIPLLAAVEQRLRIAERLASSKTRATLTGCGTRLPR